VRYIRTRDFLEEQERFALQYTCEVCVHFDVRSRLCAHGYPNGEHRGDQGLAEGDALVFCKDFELV